MRILHCCLAAFYIDNYGYQENILPKIHKLQGHDVKICTSTETYIDNKNIGYVEPRTYLNEHSIEVTRLPYYKYIPHVAVKKLRIYNGLMKVLENFLPDIIFIHDCQFISINTIATFVKRHKNIRVYVDSHTDFINSGRNWFSKNIMHKIVYKWCAKQIEPYTKKFYGTLPLRVDFYRDIYKINPSKLDLLVLGADHTDIDLGNKKEIRQRIRKELNIKDNEFVIVTGGKIDRRKNIHTLMNVFKNNNLNVKLILFGIPNVEMKVEIEALSKVENIHYIGWLQPNKIYDYLFAADLGFFPGTHSILWEQTVGIGLPCVFKKWEGIDHVDVGGNCIFLEKGDEAEIRSVIDYIYNNRKVYSQMLEISTTKGIKEFSYEEIAKKAIESN